MVSACTAPEPGLDTYHDKVRYCVYTYVIGGDDITVPVCSQYELAAEELEFLDTQFAYSAWLYRQFAQKHDLKIPKSTDLELDIYLVTYSHINDLAYFPRRNERLKIVGRYLDDRADIFVTERMFTGEGYVDFPHELAHWFNDILDVQDRERNEMLAAEFERYYIAKTR